MSRLTVVLFFCIAFSFPVFASDERAAGEEGEVFVPTVPSEVLPQSLGDQEEFEEARESFEEAVEEFSHFEDLPREVLEVLGREGIQEILVAREGLDFARDMYGMDSDFWPQAVPLAFFCTILLCVLSAQLIRYRKHAQLQTTLRLMVEKGVEIPAELLIAPPTKRNDLRRGTILVALGLSLVLLIGLVDGFGDGSWAVGLIPAFIGAGYLYVWRVSQREEDS